MIVELVVFLEVYFCVCNFHITQKYSRVTEYLKYLHLEIEILEKFIKEK